MAGRHHADTLRERTRAAVEGLAGQWVKDEASGQVHRVGRRFALVGMAGELATEAGCTGWPKSAALDAAKACFHAWLAARPSGIGNAEESQMVTQARKWFQLNEGRFVKLTRALDDRAPDKGLQAGFLRVLSADGKPVNSDGDHLREFGERMQLRDALESDIEYLMFPEVFDSEVCEGFDPQAVKRVLRDLGHLMPDKGRPFDSKQRLPGFGGKAVKCYRFRSSIRLAD